MTLDKNRVLKGGKVICMIPYCIYCKPQCLKRKIWKWQEMDSERGGYLRGSHLPWSKPQFGVNVGKRSQFHLESRLTVSSPGLQKDE